MSTGDSMYGIFLRAINLSVLYFCLIYWTKIINVVTLGGLIAGATLVGIGATLLQALVWHLVQSNIWRRIFLAIGLFLLNILVINLLPGYTILSISSAVMLLVVFYLVTCILTAITTIKER